MDDEKIVGMLKGLIQICRDGAEGSELVLKMRMILH